MNFEVEGEEHGVLKLKLEDGNDAVANSLRRAMVSRVETLAIKELEIQKNESGLFDEVLANRMGQVPWTIPKNVDGEDEVHIAAKKEGPGKLLAEDIQAGNDEAEPVNPDTLLVELKEGQAVELEGTAVLNTGRKHAKHQGGTVGYEKLGDGEYMFSVESTSGYGNRELVEEAIQTIQEDLDEFEEAVEEL
ncbi:MAG: hypothetical protein ABEJ75_02275 [Candidatus Nanohaloarchaea archaeon]